MKPEFYFWPSQQVISAFRKLLFIYLPVYFFTSRHISFFHLIFFFQQRPALCKLEVSSIMMCMTQLVSPAGAASQHLCAIQRAMVMPSPTRSGSQPWWPWGFFLQCSNSILGVRAIRYYKIDMLLYIKSTVSIFFRANPHDSKLLL